MKLQRLQNITYLVITWLIIVIIVSACQKRSLEPFTQNTNTVIPDILLTNTEGKTEQLSSYYQQKPILLIVTKGSGCSMCVMNLQQWSQRASRIQSYGWNIIALNNESVEENNKALERKGVDSSYSQPGGKFSIKLFSDSHHKAMELLECYRREVDTERHGIFAINTKGQILFSAITRRPFENYEQIFDSLRQWKIEKGKTTKSL